MRKALLIIFQILLAGSLTAMVPEVVNKKISVLWAGQMPAGRVEVLYGSVEKITISGGKGKTKGNEFTFSASAEIRLEY